MRQESLLATVSYLASRFWSSIHRASANRASFKLVDRLGENLYNENQHIVLRRACLVSPAIKEKIFGESKSCYQR